MQGNPAIIKTLNALLAAEMTAADQYFTHARMAQNWGFERLNARLMHERDEELDHADRLVRRILFLEGVPDLGRRNPMSIGQDVPAMLHNDLAYELSVVTALRTAMAQCEAERDYVTREILQGLLKDTEEDHTYWLEQQLHLLQAVGEKNYLQSLMDGCQPPAAG